jgi:SAM-dependent methyltransferase
MAWFKDWFDSPYYHLLYDKRDEKEAEKFINHLVEFLNPPEDSKMLDLACGKGRHARILSELGFDVTGVDLSENSIAEAKLHESETLHFEVHDMRKPFKPETFHYVFNLFTSFGYFENEGDNILTLNSIHKNLTANGVLIHDYLNAECLLERFKQEETKVVGGVKFSINKHIENDRIIKTISFEDKGRFCRFEEKVSLYSLDDFKDMYQETGFEITAIFGDYDLNPFDKDISERMILISRKI